jgi:hypothetical protein
VPVVNRLEDAFGERVDFFHLNIDTPDELDMAHQYEMWRRSQYTLIDADGTIVKSWFGYLNEDRMTAELEEALATLGE